jgi:signal transduction histidine kinase
VPTGAEVGEARGGPDSAGADRVNILLVDDQPNNLRALEAILEDLGQNLVLARSGADALRCLLRDDFALILLDVKMPGMDGLETAALIRHRERTRHVPIIFLTAYERDEVLTAEGYALGAVDFLSKPIIPAVLLSKVRVFVELHRKTEQVRCQAEQLRANERQGHERRLAEERQRWEMERLRAEAERERRNAELLAQKNEELARTVTERERAEAALRDADRRKDEFLAMLAHELRNPLAPVLNALHIMRLRGVPDPELEQARQTAERQVRTMARLIDDLLDVSRISRGKIQLRKEPVDLATVVARAVESSRTLVEERRHRLEVALPDDPVWLEADPTRLEQILTNLLTNAAKYTEPGGLIRLAARVEGDEVILSVTDNGIGIPPEKLETIFDMFMQVDRSLASATQWGLGIGLALVRSLVQMHGGRVYARSDGPGRGSEFVVHLPRIAAPVPAPQGLPGPPAPAEVNGGRPLRLLVVDDNQDAASSLALLLSLKGHTVALAHDGPSALEAARTGRPQVVILDIALPGMDGYEVARRLRAEEATRDAVLVAMTGYGQEDDHRRSRQAGFNHHLVKPVDFAELQQLFAEVD